MEHKKWDRRFVFHTYTMYVVSKMITICTFIESMLNIFFKEKEWAREKIRVKNKQNLKRHKNPSINKILIFIFNASGVLLHHNKNYKLFFFIYSKIR